MYSVFAAKAENRLTFKAQGRPDCGSVVAVSIVYGVPLLLLPFGAGLLFVTIVLGPGWIVLARG